MCSLLASSFGLGSSGAQGNNTACANLGRVWKVDDREVVIQIDRDKDIKGRFAKSAIFEVILDEASGSKQPSDDAIRELEQRAK